MNKPIMTLPCKMRLSDLEQGNNGYHCNACDKTLTDFRGKTPAETVSIIQSATHKVCGIFEPDQFTHKTSTISIPITRSSVGLSLLGILGFLGPVLSSCEKQDLPMHEQKAKAFNNLKFPMTINGSLRDAKSKKPLAYSPIEIQQNGQVILKSTTDEHGDFSITIQEKDLKNETFDLIYSAIGHQSDTLRKQRFSKLLSARKLSLTLQANVACEKTVTIKETTLQGDVYIEPIIEEPLSGSVIDYVEPPAPLELGEPALINRLNNSEPSSNRDRKKAKRLFRKSRQ